MKILTVYPTSINTRHIDEAAQVLRDGGLVIIPTGGIYAIACDALSRSAVQHLCRLRDIDPARHLMSLICSDISMAAGYVNISTNDYRILNRFLPGPYTFILPALTRLPKTFKNRRTVGVRVPDSPVTRALVEALGNPLFSVGVDTDSEDYTPVDPQQIAHEYENDVALTIDSGEGTAIPSTVVSLVGDDAPQVVRQGAGIFDL